MLMAYLLEFVLVPYTICTDIESTLYNSDGTVTINFYLEMIIDVLHTMNILIIFITAIKGDFGWIETWNKIAFAYVT
jgi:hypothetical protein